MSKKKRADSDAATPAMAQLERLGVPFTIHEYQHNADHMDQGYGIEAAKKLGLDPRTVYKTLMADTGKERVIGIVPVTGHLNLKHLAAAVGAKKARMADKAQAERESGYVLGGISPFGQRTQHVTVLDQDALEFETIMVSGGKRGISLGLDPRDLIRVLKAKTAPLATD